MRSSRRLHSKGAQYGAACEMGGQQSFHVGIYAFIFAWNEFLWLLLTLA